MNALEIKDLSKSFGTFSLQNLTLTVPMGTALGLIGENGAGKSTTISLILGQLRRDSGEIRILGQDTDGDSVSVREDIGVVFDESCFPDGLNARQVDKVERCIYKNWDSGAFYEHIRRFDLPETKPFKEYSRGMKMKLALAVALSHKAKLLLLDEATGGLDPLARDELIDELSRFISDGEHAILFSSHIVSDIEKLCGRVAFLHKGRLILSEEKEALLAAHPGQSLEEIILDITRKERAQCRVQLVLTGVYLLLPLFTSVGMMLLAMMPIYALGYDERCRWERYALAMPVRKSDLFWSRFLLGVIAIALGAAVQTLAALLTRRGELLSSLAVTAPSAVVYLLITLPLMMKLGVEKGRFLLLLLTMAFMLLSGAAA